MGGPVQALFNNSHFDETVTIPGAPLAIRRANRNTCRRNNGIGLIINTTVDAHPIHIHLTQWQLVSRQAFNAKQYLAAYATAWAPKRSCCAEFPAGQGYPGGGGSPLPYDNSKC